MKIKGKLFVLVIMTVMLASFATNLVIIINEERVRNDRFGLRLSKSMQDLSQLLADYQYITIESAKSLTHNRDFSASLYFLGYYSTLLENSSSYDNELKVFSESLYKDIFKVALDELVIYDISGKAIIEVEKGIGAHWNVNKNNQSLDSNIKDDMIFFNLSKNKEMQITYIAPIYQNVENDGVPIGFAKTAKYLSNDFYDELKKLDGVEVDSAYIRNDESEKKLKELWDFTAEPVSFPYSTVADPNIQFDSKYAQSIQRFDIDDEGAVYFHIALPSYILPFSFTNILLMFLSAFVILLVLLIPFWWFFMNRTLIAPISRLLDISDKVKNGDYKTIAPELKEEDEFNDLEKSFISMVDAIKDREKLLDKANRSLTEKVERETIRRMKNEQVMLEQKKFADMGQMINAIAHQWRQPLNGLSLVVQNICEEAEDGKKEELEQYENTAMTLIEHMSKTIDDFSVFFSSSKEVIKYDVIEVICAVINMVSSQMENSGIRLNFRCSCKNNEYHCSHIVPSPDCDKEWSSVRGLPGELKQAVLNLLHNSRDSIQTRAASEKSYEGEIDLVVECFDSDIKISVFDNGTGIPTEILDDIYTPYFTTKAEGTGIGLYMTRIVVQDNLKGSISAYNHGDGAVFMIIIPKDIKEEAEK